MQLLLGQLSDVYGRRRVLLLALVGYCCASLACSLAPSIEAMWVGLRLRCRARFRARAQVRAGLVTPSIACSLATSIEAM